MLQLNGFLENPLWQIVVGGVFFGGREGLRRLKKTPDDSPEVLKAKQKQTAK